MTTDFDVAARCRAILLLAALTGCAGLNSQTYSFATLDEARQAGAIANGWLPEGLPRSSHDIRVAQVPNTSQHWGIINFPESEESTLRGLLQQNEAPLDGVDCDVPARIEWWPVVLRGELDPGRVTATGLKAYRSKSGGLMFAVNWKQGRAYYWGR